MTYVGVSFVLGHYESIVDHLSMKGKGPTKGKPEVIIIDDSPVKQTPDDKRHEIKCEIKAWVRYFLSIFFSPNNSPSKTMKNVFYFI